MRYRLQRHDGTDCSATMVPITVLRMVPIQRYRQIWKRFLNMFYLTSFKDKFEGIKLNAFGETIFFLSKIFISYGIYQTIVAFRKFSK